MVSAIVVAAGRSTRMGMNKLFLKIGGVPAVVRSMLAFETAPSVEEMIVVTRAEYREQFAVWITLGGDTRQQSVLAGVRAASEQACYFAVHDGARPFVDPHDIEQVIADAKEHGAATLGVPVKDTIKVVAGDGFIEQTPDRSLLFITQTPQVFRRAVYLEGIRAAERDGMDFTDDCQLVEHAGNRVYMTKGSYRNIKLTTGDDLAVAQAFAERKDD